MAFWAYMLRCADGTYYTGHTDDLEHRLAQHAVGRGGSYTSSRQPIELVWCADFATRYEALDSELKVKNWSRAKKEGLIAGDWNKVSHFAKPPSRRMPRHDVSTSSTSARHERDSLANSVRVERGSSAAENPSRDTSSQPVLRHDVSTSSSSARHERDSLANSVRVERSSSAAENPSRDTSSQSAPRHDVSTSSTSARHERDRLANSVRVERSSSAAENPSRDTARYKPIIVLVRPQLGENIGKAARAMLNFGLTEMRLVEPRDGWPNPAAGPAASGADRVLAEAKVFATTAEAVADCANVYATTVRKRGVTKPVVTPEAAAREIHGQPGRSAILFGPERSGLETSDVALARAILTVPINPDFGSLNLAQAVILVAYEWSKHVPSDAEGGAALVSPTEEELLPPAPQEDLEGLIAHLTRLLEPKGYFLPVSRREATQTTLRTMLTKPGWNHLEVRTLRGVLSALERTEDRAPR